MTEPMPKGLIRVDPADVGLTRRRRGRGWSYFDATGAPITDAELIARIKALVIPPAWQDVWISPDAQGHIQAIGTDAAGRRQYRYHDDWRTARDREKHDRVLTLGKRLVKVRTEVVERLGAAGLGRDRVLAGGVRMLDLGVFRAGGEEYAPGDDDDDGTFGLATLRREHVTLKRGAVLFSYPAKGGVPRAVSLKDPLLHKMVNSLLRRQGGGEDLLVYRNGRRDWHDVRAEDLNAAVKELAGDRFTCKDLRTWNATVLAAVALAVSGPAATGSKTARNRAKARAVKEVSRYLGNTPAVCRASYIDPRVFDRFDGGLTIGGALPELVEDTGPWPVVQRAVEEAVLDLIADNRESDLVEEGVELAAVA
jgi:DNA topoisomerase IB